MVFTFSRPKYHAIPTTVDGHRFDSKLEAAYYEHLSLDPAVLHIDIHPVATIGHGDRVKLDFLVWYASGVVVYVDVKGATKTRAASEFRRVQKRWRHPAAALVAVTKVRGIWQKWE